jgi:CRISPR-associated protein Cmr3
MSNTHQLYKIKLKPLENFFFGNEQGFGFNNELSYFAASNYYPQQSGLLGLLRYRLLEMRDWLKDHEGKSQGNSKDLEDLIGKMGFRENQTDYGAIQGLSPVFLNDGEHDYWPGALNKGYTFERHHAAAETAYSYGGTNLEEEKSRAFLPSLGNGFDYKDPTDSHLLNLKTENTCNYEQVFKSYERVGITKKRDGESDDKAFFKQSTYRFAHKNWSFCLYARLSEPVGAELAQYCAQNPHVFFGGERSKFSMSLEAIAQIDPKPFEAYLKNADTNAQTTQVILLSDAKLDPGIYQQCDFAVSKVVDFRSINTDQQTKNHHGLARAGANNSQGQASKSQGYQLLSRGSVFYLNEQQVQAFAQALQQYNGFRVAGYNAFALLQNGKIEFNCELTNPSKS